MLVKYNYMDILKIMPNIIFNIPFNIYIYRERERERDLFEKWLPFNHSFMCI